MCGRYTLATPDPFDVRARFPVGESVAIEQRFNVAPGDDVLAVTTDKEGTPRGELLKWGLVPSWSKSGNATSPTPKMINARVETVAERPAFKRAFERYRCLIIADGFYEWRKPDESHPRKQPFHITRDDRGLFAFAGLWSIWYAADDTKLRSCAILTTRANDAIAPLHDRMPVILAPEHEGAWLDPSTSPAELDEMLLGLTSEHTALRPVGTAVNNARYDGPECLDAPSEDPQATLF